MNGLVLLATTHFLYFFFSKIAEILAQTFVCGSTRLRQTAKTSPRKFVAKGVNKIH